MRLTDEPSPMACVVRTTETLAALIEVD